jgi:hypothetical protein
MMSLRRASGEGEWGRKMVREMERAGDSEGDEEGERHVPKNKHIHRVCAWGSDSECMRKWW